MVTELLSGSVELINLKVRARRYRAEALRLVLPGQPIRLHDQHSLRFRTQLNS